MFPIFPGKDGTLFMIVDSAFDRGHEGTAIFAYVVRGEVRINDEVEIIGLDKATKASILRLQDLHTPIEQAHAGQLAIVFTKDIPAKALDRGMAIVAPGSVRAYSMLRCHLQILNKLFRDQDTDQQLLIDVMNRRYFSILYSRNFATSMLYYGTHSVPCIVTDGEDKPINWVDCKADQTFDINIRLEKPMAFENGWQFMITEYRTHAIHLVGVGSITNLEG